MEVDMAANDPSHPQQPPDVPSPSDEQKQPRKIAPPGWLLAPLFLLMAGTCAYSYISTSLHDPVPGIVNQYYTAVKNQDYATAYGYLGLHVITSYDRSHPARMVRWGFPGGRPFMAQSDFTQAAQDTDTADGKVRTFSIVNTGLPLDGSWVLTGTATVSVTRNGVPYYVDLNLEQIGDAWEIVGYDRF
jgi:hypothetical protein